jgi:hypothetical protein
MPLNINISSTIKLCCEKLESIVLFSITPYKIVPNDKFLSNSTFKMCCGHYRPFLIQFQQNTRWNLRNT